MRIAIIGTGISGNVCGYLLHRDHEVTVFEAADYVGGHANTIDVRAFETDYAVDTGFMVFNDRTYPNFVRLLNQLEIAAQPSDMSFGVHCDRTGLEYQGSDLNGIFAQRRNLLRPRFYGMLRDILRFNRHATAVLHELDDQLTMGEFVNRHGYGDAFINQYLVPMGAAIWSAQPDGFLDFPARFLIGFFNNHGLLQVTNQPKWQTVSGFSKNYVAAMTAGFRDRIRLSTPVTQVARHDDCVVVQTRHGEESFDHVIFATHADQALQLLRYPTEPESSILSQFPYQTNEAVVHWDETLLPTEKRAWASWNYHIPNDNHSPVTVTYDLNRLQNLGAPGPICVTLNPNGRVRTDRVLRRIQYEHPVFSRGAITAQSRHARISGTHRTHFCGAYWANGFHEDGVTSALTVTRWFGKDLDSV